MGALVTPGEFSTWTGGRIAEDDPRVQALLDGATHAIRQYCGWHIAGTELDTMILDAEGGRVLTLPTLHVTNVQEVKVCGEVLDVAAYDWSRLGNIELRAGQWPDRYRSVEVTLEHGFPAAPDVAQIIKQVCASAISSPMGATREQSGAVSISWATTAPNVAGGLSLLQRDLDVLATYRIQGGI